jgi:hypothetical protein
LSSGWAGRSCSLVGSSKASIDRAVAPADVGCWGGSTRLVVAMGSIRAVAARPRLPGDTSGGSSAGSTCCTSNGGSICRPSVPPWRWFFPIRRWYARRTGTTPGRAFLPLGRVWYGCRGAAGRSTWRARTVFVVMVGIAALLQGIPVARPPGGDGGRGGHGSHLSPGGVRPRRGSVTRGRRRRCPRSGLPPGRCSLRWRSPRHPGPAR